MVNRMLDMKFAVIVIILVSALFATGAYGQMAGEEKAPSPVINAIASGQPQDVIVLFDDADTENQAALMRKNIGAGHDTPEILAVKKAGYDARKQKVLSGFLYGEEETLIDYSHLPMMFMRVKTQGAMTHLLAQPEVVRVYADEKYRHFLTSSLPFINQPQVAALNMKGAGTAVAVIDTGVNYLNTAFGTCTSTNAPGDCLSVPAAHASCKVACVHDFAPNDGALDADGHGTNVSGIVVGVAPDTKVIGLDVFSGSTASGSDIVAAMNWCIANKAAYNIVALNMSLGAGLYTSPCAGDLFASPVNLAKNAGILSAIASGNDGATGALSSPACVPGAVSVGAVYDANYGTRSWSSCSDPTTAPDKVTCFSNSADFLTILAPGSFITAAGITMSGTSQATPHIAGSIAVLRGQNAFPSDTLDQTVARMTNTGHPDTDTRSGAGGRVKPRIDLLAAVGGSGGGGGGGGGTLSISGSVIYGRTLLPGVTITLSGSASGTKTTGSNGAYSFTGLGDGSYTISPSKTGYSFTPASRSVNLSGTNASAQNFSATLGGGGATFSISGKVTSGGLPLSGVTMALTGSGTGSVTTNASGNYTFTGLAGGTYTVTPSMTGYTFTPSSQSVSISGANASGVNFTGAAAGGGGGTFAISGTVTTKTSRLAGVTMTLTGGANKTTTTDGNGNYTFTGLAAGTYTVTPSMATKIFTPASRTATINGTNITAQNFLGTP